MKRMTNREYRTRMAWYREQVHHPDRSDYYLMQIAGYIAHIMSSRQWTPSDMKIRFDTEPDTEEKKQCQTEAAKRRWNQRVAMNELAERRRRSMYGRGGNRTYGRSPHGRS